MQPHGTPREFYQNTIASEERKEVQLRTQLNHLANTVPLPNENPPRHKIMPMLEMEFRLCQERLAMLRATPPRGDEWPSEWVVRYHHMTHHHSAQLIARMREMGLAANRNQNDAHVVHQPRARDEQQQHNGDAEEIRRRDEHAAAERRRRAEIERQPLAAPAPEPVPPGVPDPQRPIPRQAAPVRAGGPAGVNDNNNLNQNNNREAAGFQHIVQGDMNNAIAAAVAAAQEHAHNHGHGHLPAHRHTQLTINPRDDPEDASTMGDGTWSVQGLLRMATRFNAVPSRNWDFFPMLVRFIGLVVGMDAVLSYAVHALCSFDLVEGWGEAVGAEKGQADFTATQRERWSLQKQSYAFYSECIIRPFDHIPIEFCIACILLSSMALCTLFNRQREIGYCILSILIAFRISPPSTPPRANLLARVSFRLVAFIAGDSIPPIYPTSMLCADRFPQLLGLLMMHLKMPCYFERAVQYKFLTPRVRQYIFGITKKMAIFICSISPIAVGVWAMSQNVKSGVLEEENAVRTLLLGSLPHALTMVILYPSIIILLVTNVAIMEEVYLMAGSSVEGVGGGNSAMLYDLLWGGIAAIQEQSWGAVDHLCLLLFKGRAMRELGQTIKMCSGEEGTLSPEVVQRLAQRTVPSEILHRSRVYAVAHFQAAMTTIFGYLNHSSILWMALPMCSMGLSIFTVFRSVAVEAIALMAVVPLIRFCFFPVPRWYLADVCAGHKPPPFSAYWLGGSLADGHISVQMKEKRFSMRSAVARILMKLSKGFTGFYLQYKWKEGDAFGRIDVDIIVEHVGSPLNGTNSSTKSDVWDTLGLKGAHAAIASHCRKQGVQCIAVQHSMSDLCPSIPPLEFIAYMTLANGKVGIGADTQIPHSFAPFEGLFKFACARYSPTPPSTLPTTISTSPTPLAMDADRDLCNAMRVAVDAITLSAHPERMLERLLQCDAFITLVHVACGMCASVVTKPPGHIHHRRLPLCEWESSLLDAEVMAGMLPTSGLILRLALFALDATLMRGLGVGVVADDKSMKSFAERAIMKGEISAAERSAVLEQRRKLRKELQIRQASLARAVWTNMPRLCGFVTNHESLFDAVEGRALPPFVLQQDSAFPNDPKAVSISVESITIGENTALNMRGVAAMLIAAAFEWDGMDEALEGLKAAAEVITVQRRVELHRVALLNKRSDDNLFYSINRLTKAILYVIAKRRYSKAMTSGFYGGMLELLAVLMHSHQRTVDSSSSLASASSNVLPQIEWTSSLSDARMYHRAGDASIMLSKAYGDTATLPFKVRPYDSTMRVYDLLVQLFDAEHWSILTALQGDAFSGLAMHRGDGLVAAVLGQALPPSRLRKLPGGFVSVLDDDTMRQVLRRTGVQSAILQIERTWQGLQHRLHHQLHASVVKTYSTRPPAIVEEMRVIHANLHASLQRIVSSLRIVLAVMGSDVDGYRFASDAARLNQFSARCLEIKAALMPIVKTTNGLLREGGGTDVGVQMGGILDPFLFVHDSVIPRMQAARFPNVAFDTMATRIVGRSWAHSGGANPRRSHEELLADAQSDPLFLPRADHEANPNTVPTTTENQPSPPNGSTFRPMPPMPMTRVPPVGVAARSGAIPLADKPMCITPLDAHRWWLLSVILHPTYSPSRIEHKVVVIEMATEILLALDSINAARSIHACSDGGYAVHAHQDATDVCSICLEALDGNGKWVDDNFLSRSERSNILGRGVDAPQPAPLHAAYASRLSPRILANVKEEERRRGANPSPSSAAIGSSSVANPTVLTTCGHTFHQACLVGLLKQSYRGTGKCPMCRLVLTSEEEEKVEVFSGASRPTDAPRQPEVAAAVLVEDEGRVIHVAALD